MYAYVSKWCISCRVLTKNLRTCHSLNVEWYQNCSTVRRLWRPTSSSKMGQSAAESWRLDKWMRITFRQLKCFVWLLSCVSSKNFLTLPDSCYYIGIFWSARWRTNQRMCTLEACQQIGPQQARIHPWPTGHNFERILLLFLLGR